METLSDIVAEMRDEMTGTHYVADGMINSLHKAQAELRVLADRIEAAVARERRPGNAAAMREACENIAGYAETARCHTDDAHILGYLEQIEKWASAALSGPARQCDVGTAEEKYQRWVHFCEQRLHSCHNCECKSPVGCTFQFGDMPYEAQEGAGR